MTASTNVTTELHTIPLPTDSRKNWLNIASKLLSTSECNDLISEHSSSLEPQAGTFTSRSRSIFQDASLASTLWTRLHPFYSTTTFNDEDGYEWFPTHVNEHFRFCKYVAGDGFAPHIDGEKLLSTNTQSMVTVNIYLNSTPVEAGGATRIIVPYDGKQLELHETASAPSVSIESDKTVLHQNQIHINNKPYHVLHEVYPIAGSAAIFPAGGPLHDGAVVLSGEKYLLRTDIVFQRKPAFRLESEKLEGLVGEEREKLAEELGRKALQIASQLEDGGGNEAWEWYRRAFKICPKLESDG